MKVTLGTFKADCKIRDGIVDVIESGRLSYGKYSRALESEFAWVMDRKYGVLSNSGTSSLVVALLALKDHRGWDKYTEVLIPSITFVATYNAVVHAGLKPTIVDVDLHTWDFGQEEIEKYRTYSTGAVIVANLFGKPGRLEEVSLWCNSGKYTYDSPVLIEDSCEAIGATHNGHGVGEYGDISVFSFYMAHILTAGVGGMAVTDEVVLANLMRSYVNHGLSTDNLPDEFDSSFLGRDFRFDRIGHSYRITELEAVIALSKLRSLYETITKRQTVAQWYMDEMQDMIGEHFDVAKLQPGDTSSWQMFPIVLLNEDKHDLKAHLRECGIECRDMLPLTNQPCYADRIDPDDYPNAHYINNHGLYFGCHEDITEEQVEYVSTKIREYFG